MKAAFLITAHDQPSHLAKLVEALRCDWTRFFIHIDKKADLAEFRECLPADGSVVLLEGSQRLRIHWGGLSQVRATLNLLEAGLGSGEGFDRFCFLSGSDFPIKSLETIRDAFESDREFMRVDWRLDAAGDSVHCNSVKYRHFNDSPFHKALTLLPKLPRKLYGGINLYHGCNWWALTKACVTHIADFVARHEAYTAFHKRTLCADEVFFHSIVKSSPFAENITHDFERATDMKAYYALNEHGCHYIDWYAEGVPLPKVLDESDLDKLLASDALFARKFREPDSNCLRQRIVEVIGR